MLWTRKDSHLAAAFARSAAQSASEAAGHRQSRSRALRPGRGCGADQPQALRRRSSLASSPPKTLPRRRSLLDSGNADAGLISLTSALTPRLSASGNYFVMPRDLYPPIEQGAVIVSHTTQRAAAHKLLDFLLSAPVQARLAKSGLTPVNPKNDGLASVILSLRLATVTTAILLAIAVPLAALLVLGRGRWLAVLEAVATLPLVLPPTVSDSSFWFFSGRAPPSGAASPRCSAIRWLSRSMAWSWARSSTAFLLPCSRWLRDSPRLIPHA